MRTSPVFSPEALQQAYEMLTEDTPLSGSRLLIEELADRRECAQCGMAWVVSPDDVAGQLVICPSCGAPAPLDAGAAIELLEIRSHPCALPMLRVTGSARTGSRRRPHSSGHRSRRGRRA